MYLAEDKMPMVMSWYNISRFAMVWHIYDFECLPIVAGVSGQPPDLDISRLSSTHKDV